MQGAQNGALWQHRGVGSSGRWEEVQEGRTIFIHLWLIHIDVWQKPTQYCKSNYPPIKNKFKIFKLKKYIWKGTFIWSKMLALSSSAEYFQCPVWSSITMSLTYFWAGLKQLLKLKKGAKKRNGNLGSEEAANTLNIKWASPDAQHQQDQRMLHLPPHLFHLLPQGSNLIFKLFDSLISEFYFIN